MKIRLHLKIFIFVAVFIVTRQIRIYGILMLFAFLHEVGHMIVGIIMGFKPNEFNIMPFGLSIGFEGKVDNYNKKIGKTSILVLKKMIIALAGPLTNIFLMVICIFFNISFLGIERELIAYSNVLIGIFNLIPIYPLDGGRILKYVLCIMLGNKESSKYTNIISYISVIVLTLFTSIAILYLKNISFVIIIGYLWYLVLRENKKYENKLKIYERLNEIRE